MPIVHVFELPRANWTSHGPKYFDESARCQNATARRLRSAKATCHLLLSLYPYYGIEPGAASKLLAREIYYLKDKSKIPPLEVVVQMVVTADKRDRERVIARTEISRKIEAKIDLLTFP